VALAALLVGALLFGRFLFPYAVPLGFDEAYMVPFAERLIDGHFVPYVDAVSQRGPVLYWLLALAQLVFGRYEWIGIRVLTLGGCLLTVAATYGAGVAARWPLAGACGGAAVVLVIAIHGGTQSLCGEAVAVPLLALAFAALAVALRRTPARTRRRAALLALSGALSALAALAKQTTAVAAGPFFLWALATGLAEATGPAPRRRALLATPGAFLAGWVAVVAALLGFYAGHHALRELVYWSTTYNSTIYMDPFRLGYWHTLGGWLGSHLLVLLGMIAVAAFAVVRPLRERGAAAGRAAAAYARAGFEVTAALNAVLLFAVALLPARFWWHYFMVVWPWVGVVLGWFLEVAGRRVGPLFLRVLGPAALVATLAGTGIFRLQAIEDQRALGSFKNPRPSPVCAEINRVAPPGESIFVWGFDGEVYINCRRPPAARFTYLTLVAGIVPPFWTVARPERVARGSHEALLADLTRTRPRVILDYPMHGFSMDRVPELGALLEHDYCELPWQGAKVKRKPRIYGRRDAVTCPATPVAPPAGADAPADDPAAGDPSHEPT
jgi:4-amino-4-deoxy-L-arabinose transferase-like glycosyltransferase